MKRILILSTVCSRTFYEELAKKRTSPVLDTQQKFMLSIVDGFSEKPNLIVDCISVVPISRSSYPDKTFYDTKECVNGVNYHYVGMINYPVIKNYTAARSVKRAVKEYYLKYKNDEVVVIADSLVWELSVGARYLQQRGVCITAIVTDIPFIAETMGSSKGIRSIYSKYYGRKADVLLKKYDKYILLSDYMNEVVNPSRKPSMVMECIADANLFEGINKKTLDMQLPVVMYAGKFYRECGVVELAKAAKELQGKCEIWLYGGHGDCMDELTKLANDTNNLRIHGIVPLNEILSIEQACSVLINPRFSEEEFSKYSFPSKTAEYMLSGVPVMMYKLPSLPKEYEEHVYLIENEGDSLAKSIGNVLMVSNEARREKGERASCFIAEKKNKNYQTNRIFSFVYDNKKEI